MFIDCVHFYYFDIDKNASWDLQLDFYTYYLHLSIKWVR